MTIKIKYSISMLLILLISAGVTAQSLDGYLELAVENNPSLKAAHLKYEAAMEVAPQVGALPDPTLSISAFGSPMTTDIGDERASLELLPMFPWFGTHKTRQEVANLHADAEYLAYVTASEQLFLELRTAYAKLHQAQRSIAFQSDTLVIQEN